MPNSAPNFRPPVDRVLEALLVGNDGEFGRGADAPFKGVLLATAGLHIDADGQHVAALAHDGLQCAVRQRGP